MFQGTIPNQVLKIVAKVVKDWKCKNLYVGCSGNFTIERAISKLIDCDIVSNDVTIYSSYIGKFLAGESLDDLRIKEEELHKCDFLGDYMEEDVDKIATLILASDILPFTKNKLIYSARMLEGYRYQYPRLHAKLKEKLLDLKTKVKRFYHGDVMDMLDEIEEGDGFISFPPFFKSGYEKMWQNLSEFFEYEEPEYEEFDPEKHIELFCEKVKSLSNFVIITEREVDSMSDYSSGCVYTANGKPTFIYSKTEKKNFIKQKAKITKAKPIVKIEETDDIGPDIEVRQITLDQFYENRALYLSTNVSKVATPSASFGLFSNDKLFGVFAFANSQMLKGSDQLERPTTYLLTDFAVSPTKEKKLSKLVLYCVLSKEVLRLCEGISKKRIKTIATNAFSNNPISMKYRGLFDLYGRKIIEKNEDGTPKKYNLSYGAKMGQWTLKEGYEKWKRK